MEIYINIDNNKDIAIKTKEELIKLTNKLNLKIIDNVEDADIIAREIQVGACSKTVRLERSIDVNKVSAKYSKGIVIVTAPKFVIPKHKVTVE